MKGTVLLSLFVLIAYHCLQANGAVTQGTTDDCSKIEGDHGKYCYRSTCHQESGYYTIDTCGVSSVSCPEGKIERPGKPDLEKPYPECCPRPYCADP